jgi:phosphoribosyl-dephospho-CoA transferase
MNDRYEHLLRKSRDAKRGGRSTWAVQSTGETVSVAIVLNRADWLEEIQYSIAEAIERSGPEWVAIIPQAARQLKEEE